MIFIRRCHPPGSVHIVDQIVEDFKSGKESSAAFWINFKERFIYIEYFAIKGKDGEYLGVVEFTQDLTKLRKLEGEQRLLNYSNE
ncbi:PAS domain-containing protein [Alkalitalea saponilacus]|uniref:PAS domain-containing protein n=1 Tax=Alkalitalea saponilacus TaxID=889453 RepID=A0A1T5BDI1_9BACT|nr:PAS domain-containing protein [Alkalitalea saponilacus]